MKRHRIEAPLGFTLRVMDGEQLDLERLSPEEVEVVKTARVLKGQSLYSHSWLKV